MKKQNAFLLAAIILSLSLSSCRQSNPKIINYYIDDNNHLIVMYDNGKTEDVGHLSDEDIATYINAITISQDGFFVINGIKTSIRVTFSSVAVSEDGYYVIDGIKTTIRVEINSITISDDGYYVVNGIKTNIKATEIYTVQFITGYSATVPSQQVAEGHKVERPQLSRTGYDLNGWFCNGEEWRFNSDVVLNNMTLVADWTAKQYTISFVNEKGDAPADMTVTFDSNYSLPTVSTVPGYTFAGWYSGSTKFSGGKWTTASNITLTAKWTAKTYTVTLNPGVGSVSKTTQSIVYGQNYT